ncbi:aldehyde oxidase GLOX-like [Apium graveolens]|uniref:aldehyde oxidase GLOX-like n=1 Tax=Apium graveolens TaxID=4045 RepID=UPI003D7B27F2
MWQLQLLFLLLANLSLHPAAAITGGKWDLLQSSIGISAMHMQLLNNNRVIMFDRTDFGMSNISLPNNKCRIDLNDTALQIDCTAHSVEYDIKKNVVRPLMVLTDTWCSSGAVMPDGRLVQTGGDNDGDFAVRTFRPCNNDTCDWEEIKYGLIKRRWYATNHILPDGRQIIIGGDGQFNYEFYPKTGGTQSYNLPFLEQTFNEHRNENNLYPFVFLNVDGNLFIFANNKSILFDYAKNVVVRTYPDIPGGDPRNYPSTGSAILLPLKNLQDDKTEAQVLVCGGAPKDGFRSAKKGNFLQALDTCGRIKITDQTPQWVMEKMPMPRVIGDMLLLPNANVLIINGCSKGTAGWELGREPALSPVLYKPDGAVGSRFETQNPSSIPRMYHSTAVLLSDGRVLVGGSNPHKSYNFTGVLFPTELSLQSFSPAYLDPGSANLRPTIVSPATQTKIEYGQQIAIRFTVPGRVNTDLVRVTMVAPAFNTHSFSMSQRLLVLGSGNATKVDGWNYEIRVTTPGSGNLAPSGFYMLFVVHQDIPSEAIWVQIQ